MKKNFTLVFLLLMALAYFGLGLNVCLAQNLDPNDENLIPLSTTAEGPQTLSGIQQVQLNSIFYQPGSKTTRLDTITAAAKVTDFTLDVPGKVKIYFQGTLDLSKPEAIEYISRINEYVNFDYLYFEVKSGLLDYFKVPLLITYYNLPYVWDPDVLKNGHEVLTSSQIQGWNLQKVDNQEDLSFVINEAGSFKIIPHFEVNINDGMVVKNSSGQLAINGRISDPKATIKISLNGEDQNNIKPQIDSQNGNFTFSLKLAEGINLVELQANSQYGDLAKISRIVNYQQPLPKAVQASSVISPVNIIAIVLAIIIVILLFLWRRLAYKRKR